MSGQRSPSVPAHEIETAHGPHNLFWVMCMKPMMDKALLSASLEARRAVNITLNGRAMHCEHDVKKELNRKGHDLMCPLSAFSIWSPMLSTRGCVKSYWGLDGNIKYESCRSEELAHRLHMKKMENRGLDLEPLAPAAKGIQAMGVGVQAMGVGTGLGVAFAGLGSLVKALKVWRG